MIQRVYEQVSLCTSIEKTIIATDDNRIYDAVQDFGGNVIMTRSDHESGTDRCMEAAEVLGAQNGDIILNIQGDEPFIDPQQIDLLGKLMKTGVKIGTLIKKCPSEQAANNPNRPKVVLSSDLEAIYFSRHSIPHGDIPFYQKWIHIGMYGYEFSTLKQLTQLSPSPLELTERL